jgi:hypothetical protein
VYVTLILQINDAKMTVEAQPKMLGSFNEYITQFSWPEQHVEKRHTACNDLLVLYYYQLVLRQYSSTKQKSRLIKRL